ncbi:hypothetical protein SCAR479_02847 [Seiridium cardinale]|uniref:Uncharacterized protein n=1 Tax=Seiridium cardinale TaxID=138064 RepID=A0ABR2Y2B0_9PEZI
MLPSGNTIIATVRDLENPNSKALHELPKVEESQLLVVEIDSNVETDTAGAVKAQSKEGVKFPRRGSSQCLYMRGPPRRIEHGFGRPSEAHQNQPPIPNSAYGPIKATVHWYTKRMNAEVETLTAFVADPD